MKKVFMTGITGLLGSNLVIDLLKEGYTVKALLRNKNSYRGTHHINLELIEGELTDDHTDHLSSTDVFIHSAAETKQNILQYADYRAINYEASKHLYYCCTKSSIQKFIYISTANTLAFGSHKEPGHENSSISYPFTKSMYAKSKLETENFLLEQKGKMDVIVLNPTFMLGPYDHKPSSGKIILMGLNKKILFYPPGGKNFVHVKNVSSGIIHSIKAAKSGEKYLIAGENLSYKAFFKKLNYIADQNPLMIRIPKIILIIFGFVGDVFRYFNVKTAVSSVNMKSLCVKNYYSNKKSVKNLGISYDSINVAIADALTYFKISINKA